MLQSKPWGRRALTWLVAVGAVAVPFGAPAPVADASPVVPLTAPSDPRYGEQRRYLESIRLPQAWSVTTGHGDLVLAVVDSGVSPGHPDLAGRLLPGRDFLDDDDFPEDTLGHGTRIATIAAARANDAGMTGVAWRAKILPVKVVDDAGYASNANLAAGIVWAADHGADVINLSIGRRPPSPAVADAIRYAQERDALIVAAAGNERTDETSFPADAEGVLAVGAVDADGHLAPFSNWGAWVDLVAPGTDILGGVPGPSYGLADGTSFAAPIVSGIALLARARFPDERAAQIAERLTGGASDIGPLGRDQYYGHGRVDAFSAVGGPVPPRPNDARHVFEPDNMAGQATPLRISEPTRAALAPEGDADWFVFDVPEVQSLWFAVAPIPGTGPGPAPQLSVDVYGEDLWRIPLNNDPGPGPAAGGTLFHPGGHYIRVRNLARTTNTPYELTVRPVRPDDPAAIYGPWWRPRVWIRDATPTAGSFDASTAAQPTIHFAEPVPSGYLTSRHSEIQLTDASTGAVVPADVVVPDPALSVTLVPRQPLLAGRVYEMSITAVPGQKLWMDPGVCCEPPECCFRFAVAAAPAVPLQASTARSGYWMVAADGAVHAFGDAGHYGRSQTQAAIVDLEPTPTGDGYWTVDSQGVVTAHGDAAWYGHADRTRVAPGEQVTSLSATPTGAGYWLFTDKGRVVTLGDAPVLGDMAKVTLNGPVLDSIPSPTGRGYYMVAADGGIFTFGDAQFAGSMGGVPLNAPVQSLVPDPDGDGYWLVASDGGVFSFTAPFRGSMGGTPLNRPVTGMVPFGNGYLMVATDGGIFNFSDRLFHGSLGGSTQPHPVVAVAVVPH